MQKRKAPVAKKLPSYWLDADPNFDAERRANIAAYTGIELTAFLRGSDGTAGIVLFKLDGGIELKRYGAVIFKGKSIAGLYRYAQQKNLEGTTL